MLNAEGFDAWAEKYEDSVAASDAEGTYPFAAYKEVLDEVFRQASQAQGRCVLDMGLGTAVLTSRLYEAGFRVTGVDFSAEMLAAAKKKMPLATLYQADFLNLPDAVMRDRFDSILFTYSIHHLPYEQQFLLLHQLIPLLQEGGRIVLGDVMTKSAEEMEQARHKDHNLWDEEEFYPVARMYAEAFPQMHVAFYQKSYCSGVLTMERHKPTQVCVN